MSKDGNTHKMLCKINKEISREWWINVRLYTDALNLKNLKEKEVKTEKDSRSKSSLSMFPNAKQGVPALDTVAGVAVRRWLISNTSLMVGFRGIRSLLARVRTWQKEAGCSHSGLSVVYTALTWIVACYTEQLFFSVLIHYFIWPVTGILTACTQRRPIFHPYVALTHMQVSVTHVFSLPTERV